MAIYINVDNCRLGFRTVYASVVGFAILVSAYLAFYGCLSDYMYILSTVIIELIIDMFTGFIIALDYYIISRFTAL